MRAEFTAYVARLEEASQLSGKVSRIVRKATNGTPVRANYVVARSSKPDRLGDDRLAGVQQFESDRRFTWDVRVVATSPDGVDVLSEAVLRQSVGFSLSVPGRTCYPIQLVEDVEEGDGYDAAADLYYRDMSFRFWSRRADA